MDISEKTKSWVLEAMLNQKARLESEIRQMEIAYDNKLDFLKTLNQAIKAVKDIN